MNPKAKKYRIRRSSGPGIQARGGPQSVGADAVGAAANNGAVTPAPAQVGGASPGSVEQEIAAIRAENLTGRQLRLARRTAQKHGLNPASDLDAVRLLRRSGVDPFQRSNMLELVTSAQQVDDADGPGLPAVTRETPPGPPMSDSAARAREIRRIQRDIARRRRLRMGLLAARLLFFVMLPTLLAGYYYFRVATPMYATNAEFVIQQAETAAAPNLGGLFSGTGFATSQDSIAVQSYLTSRDAMMRLDRDLGHRQVGGPEEGKHPGHAEADHPQGRDGTVAPAGTDGVSIAIWASRRISASRGSTRSSACLPTPRMKRPTGSTSAM